MFSREATNDTNRWKNLMVQQIWMMIYLCNSEKGGTKEGNQCLAGNRSDTRRPLQQTMRSEVKKGDFDHKCLFMHVKLEKASLPK